MIDLLLITAGMTAIGLVLSIGWIKLLDKYL